MNGLYPQSVALADVGCSRSVKTTYLVTPRASMLCFVLINSVLLNLLRVWTKHSVHETVPEAMQCYCQLPPDPTDNSRTRRIFTHKRSERTCDTLTSGRDQYPVKQNCVRHNRLRPRWRRWQIHSPPPFFFLFFSKLQNDTWTTVERWKMRCRILTCCWLIYLLFVPCFRVQCLEC